MYMKKWWLEFQLDTGERWQGFINTTAENREDFPETLEGEFNSWNDGEGARGYFTTTEGSDGYVFGGLYEVEEVVYTSNGRQVIPSTTVKDSWEYLQMHIEDCLNLKRTYIMDCNPPEPVEKELPKVTLNIHKASGKYYDTREVVFPEHLDAWERKEFLDDYVDDLQYSIGFLFTAFDEEVLPVPYVRRKTV